MSTYLPMSQQQNTQLLKSVICKQSNS